MSMSKRRWIIMGTVAGLLATAVAVLVTAMPSVAATACPQCYGLTSLGDGVYADRDDPGYRRMIDAADQRIAAFYGDRQTSPRVLICSTSDCYRRIGGGAEKGRTVLTWAFLLSPVGSDPNGLGETIATHELSHTEFHHRLGDAKSGVPYWFDEGLAVLVSEDARYLKPATEPDRCRLPWAEARTALDTPAGRRTERTYMQAACLVSRWTAENGGRDGIRRLIDDLRAGKPFTDLVTLPSG
jgi:hypothetical protein